MSHNLIQELRWRGMIHDIIPGTEEQFNKEVTTAYIGFDPTADSLHIGSLLPIILLVHLQKSGHKPIALIGGGTGCIGDPSGKSEERKLLDREVIIQNEIGIIKQLDRFFIPGTLTIVNNRDWLESINVLDFARNVGKHITVASMLSKESVKRRIDDGLSFTEFIYQLIQGFDFMWLFKNMNCKVQMGGSDQWGNIVTGSDLIRKKHHKDVFAFTCPLITKSNGSKFGKTEKGNIWLDPNKTSPFQFFQFWLNSSDQDAESWIKIFTFMGESEINDLISDHRRNPTHRLLQNRLAMEVTLFVHGEVGLREAMLITDKNFNPKPVNELTVEDIECLDNVSKFSFSKQRVLSGVGIVTFLKDSNIFDSKSKAKQMVVSGGISINRRKVDRITYSVDPRNLLHNRFILVQIGKKNHMVVEVI